MFLNAFIFFKNDLNNIFKNYYFYKMLRNDFIIIILYIIYYIQIVFTKSFRITFRKYK